MILPAETSSPVTRDRIFSVIVLAIRSLPGGEPDGVGQGFAAPHPRVPHLFLPPLLARKFAGLRALRGGDDDDPVAVADDIVGRARC